MSIVHPAHLTPGPAAYDIDAERHLVAALRNGDEPAFVSLVDRHHARMLHLAQLYLADRAAAEEVVQDAWLGFLQSLERFEGRCSLSTWLFRILINKARTRRQRERHTFTFSQMGSLDDGEDEPAVSPDRFAQNGHWTSAPQSWDEIPDECLLANETRSHVLAAVESLPERQKLVITLRDIEGWPSDEVCEVLEITAIHQRVLLHRARSAVRQALEVYLSHTPRAET
jgi:RNA polymerase sigma-70 factor (ECF subfamily)